MEIEEALNDIYIDNEHDIRRMGNDPKRFIEKNIDDVVYEFNREIDFPEELKDLLGFIANNDAIFNIDSDPDYLGFLIEKLDKVIDKVDH